MKQKLKVAAPFIHSMKNTWCPKCRKITKVETKGYYLLGQKRRDDQFCKNCGTKVILECANEEQYHKKIFAYIIFNTTCSTLTLIHIRQHYIIIIWYLRDVLDSRR